MTYFYQQFLRPALFLLLCFSARGETSLQFEVGCASNLLSAPLNGRLLVVFSLENSPEPRKNLGHSGLDAPFTIARDVTNWTAGQIQTVTAQCLTFPINHLSELLPGDYYVQAVLMSNLDLRGPNMPGNLFGEVHKFHLDPKNSGQVALEINQQIPPEQLPPDQELVKFIKIKSELLSRFWGRPMYLRAGIILPRDYAQNPARKYPLWIRIGGLASRYTAVTSLMNEKNDFHRIWLADESPRMIMLQLDGAGPYGDPYQVNSANNGPYGDAVTQELIPYVEKIFRAGGTSKTRVLSGLSTGGWVSLALQIFYPDFFNGTWTFCPDGIDFRAFELINIYTDENAYTNQYNVERPSERTVSGDVVMLMRREVQLENILGSRDSWTMSGEQWGDWNATYSPRGADGRPAALWDPQTGKIDHAVAEQWKKYDLRMVLQENWPALAPKLQGKLHISVGDADNYFLNNAVHLMDTFLTHAQPPFQGRIVYGPGHGHGWTDLSIPEIMNEMAAATGATN